MADHPTVPCAIEDAIEDVGAAILVVPNELRDAINAELDRLLDGMPQEAQDCREHFYQQFLAYFHKYGCLPKGEITKTEGATDG